jgi:hypothetical protein
VSVKFVTTRAVGAAKVAGFVGGGVGGVDDLLQETRRVASVRATKDKEVFMLFIGQVLALIYP